jgi:thioredoxin 1
MAEILKLTDADYTTTLESGKPLLVLFSNGNDLRNEFSVAFKKAAEEANDIVFAQIEIASNPQAAQQFEISTKATLVAYYNGEVLTRRSRPWGTDVPLAVELLQDVMPVDQNQPIEEEQKPKEQAIVDTKPVVVTDETFQTEAIDYHLPVVVDFWAPWCGPCRMVAPILDKLAEEYAGKVRIVKVNVDENPQLSQAFQVMSIPTIMMLKERNIVFSQPGALPEPAMRDLFDQLIDLEIPPQEESEAETENS